SNRAGGVGMGDLYAASRTSITTQFSGPRNLTELNTTDAEYAPALNHDGLRLYYTVNNIIYARERATVDAPFGATAVMIAGPTAQYSALAGTEVSDDEL